VQGLKPKIYNILGGMSKTHALTLVSQVDAITMGTRGGAPQRLPARCGHDAEQSGDPLPRYAAADQRALAKSNPSAYQPYVATTLNNLANLYRAIRCS
jgi:hypothetical protein